MKKLLTGLTALSTVVTLAMATPTTIDTLVLYSQGASDKYDGDAETRIEHLIATTNKIYQDSGLDFKLNVVKVQQYEIDDTVVSNKVLGAISKDAEIAKLRNEVGADNVVIYRPYAHDGQCGVGFQNNYLSHPNALWWIERYMFAQISIDCGGYVTAHEVGHNAGLGHSERQNSGGTYPYARGYGVDNTFGTVMAYIGAYKTTNKVYKFSSPDLECTDGLPCGVAEGEEKESDAVKALNQTLPLLANFREHVPVTTDEKLAIALKAFDKQKVKLEEVKVERDTLKNVFTEKKDAYEVISTAYETKKAEHLTKKEHLAQLKNSGTKAEIKAYYNDTYKPSILALKAYKEDVKKPAFTVLKDAQTAYKDFTETTFKVEQSKLVELRAVYQALKKA